MIKDKKILYISPRYFFPANDGAKIVFYNTVKELSKYNKLDCITNVSKEDFGPNLKENKKFFDNFLFDNRDVSKQSFKELLISLIKEESYFFRKYYSKSFLKMISELMQKNNYDIVWLESAYMTIFSEYIKKLNPKVKIISRSHNVEHLLLERIASEEKIRIKKFFIEREAKFWKDLEFKYLKFVDKFFTITETDKKYFLKKYSSLSKKTEVLLPGVDFEKYSPNGLTKEKNIVFIGAMDYFPNIQAVKWFKEKVFDEISIFNKEIKFYIIGKNAPDSVKDLASDRIIVEDGKNKDVFYYEQARIFIVPLLSGSGLKLKVLNALSMEKPVLSTTIGLEGIPLKNNKEVFCSDNPEEWKKIILQNISKSDTLEKIAWNAREVVYRNFNWEKNMGKIHI